MSMALGIALAVAYPNLPDVTGLADYRPKLPLRVLAANGELIGTNFDRVWEGTMSDIDFDPEKCRNISLDIRFTLFVIDKFAGCKRLVDEMKIVR